MPDILLSTLNARYSHASLSLRYLYANLQHLQTAAQIKEFTINMRPLDIAEQIIAENPRIIGFSIYIWNVQETLAVIQLLKTVRPDITVILGGPEVSYETEKQAIVQWADHVVTGPGEVSFRELCIDLLASASEPMTASLIEHTPRPPNVIPGKNLPLQQLNLPYECYNSEDITQRVVYVEASRGCPFKCEFCLSSLDKTAYPFELKRFLDAMGALWQKGLRQYKFVDRTFNLKISTTLAILDFFLERIDEATFLHFELIPDHLPATLKTKIQQFPAGSLQFEIGIQSFDPDIQTLISRKQNNEKSIANIQWLRQHSTAYLHTDLIFGLPGETLDSFAKSFDQLVALNPHEIQVGILKRLRGTPIIRHTQAYQMRYNPLPPYNVLETRDIDFATLQDMNRFARYWDLIGNSGHFTQTLPLLLANAPFERFWALSQWLYQHTQQTHRIALPRLFVYVHQAGQTLLNIPQDELEDVLQQDYKLTGQKGAIPFLPAPSAKDSTAKKHKHQQRQLRHRRPVASESTSP